MVHRSLPLKAVQTGESRRYDLDGEVAFAAIGIVSAVAAMLLAVVDDFEVRRTERFGETFGDFRGDWAG